MSDRTVKDGDTDVTLSCKLAERYEDIDVSWYKNGKVCHNSSVQSKFQMTQIQETMKRFLSHVLDVRYDLSVTKGDTKTNHKLQHIELTNDTTATDYCCSDLLQRFRFEA